MDADVSRRRFLTTTGTFGGISWLKLTSPALAALTASACSARDSAASFTSLSGSEATEVSAIAARIIPTTDTPGATEAGVIHFIDRSVGNGVMWGTLDEFRDGLAGFEEAVAAEHPGRSFSELTAPEQDAFLTTQEGAGFFELVREMTIIGFFAMSSYGGNREHVGWSLIGFGGHAAWTHPFGYYDAQESGNAG